MQAVIIDNTKKVPHYYLIDSSLQDIIQVIRSMFLPDDRRKRFTQLKNYPFVKKVLNPTLPDEVFRLCWDNRSLDIKNNRTFRCFYYECEPPSRNELARIFTGAIYARLQPDNQLLIL